MQPRHVYFLSDAHLGATLPGNDRDRERRLVTFLETGRPACAALYLLGDMFDFWFEYTRVVPRGHVRFLATLARYTDAGIPVHYFAGNHDAWVGDYLPRECGVIIYRDNEHVTLHDKQFLLGHGDGLDPADKKYLYLRRLFRAAASRRLFRLIHPDAGIRLANACSSRSRRHPRGNTLATTYRGDDHEPIARYCKNILLQRHVDYFIFGHRHLPLDITLSPNSRYINTGDWITHFTYAVFDGETVRLHRAR